MNQQIQTILLYIDPGSTSYLVQMIIGGVLGFFFFFKSAFRYLKSQFQRVVSVLFNKKTNDE